MGAEKGATLGISKALKVRLKEYCDPRGMSLVFFVDKALSAELDRLKEEEV